MPAELTMREPMVGSLIYGDHKVPKKTRPWKERWKLPSAVGAVFVIAILLVYQFANYRQEGAVTEFINDVFNGRYEAAYSRWDTADGRYSMQDFLNDWGKDGYYTRNATTAKVMDSNSRGQAVVVYISLVTFRLPLAISVDKETLKFSYSQTNKYRARASHEQ